MFAVYLSKSDAEGIGRLVDIITDRNFPTHREARRAAQQRWGKMTREAGSRVCVVDTREEEWAFLRVENLRVLLAS